MPPTPGCSGAAVPFRVALRVWAAIGLMSFGGPAGQIALMHRVLVEERRWVSSARFLSALNYCMLLPGPEAQQLATYVGWLLHGYRGGLAAGLLFILPGFAAILALSLLYVLGREFLLVEAVFFGLKAAVVAIVAQALVRLGRRVLSGPLALSLAGGAFLALFVVAVPFPLVIAGAAIVGYIALRVAGRGAPLVQVPESATTATGHAAAKRNDAERDGIQRAAVAHAIPPQRSWRHVLGVAFTGLAVWWLPWIVLRLWLGADHILPRIGLFFSRAAVVTFGGAYAVLAYIAQQAVESYHWLGADQMLDGLAMAETTPGPLIQVVQFVGFMAAHNFPHGLPPLWAAVAGAVLTTWVTFVPCFLWIFLGAPYIEILQRLESVQASLAAITAAVVGVMLNLSLWFALHTFFGRVETWLLPGGLRLQMPAWSTLDPAAVLLSAAALLALTRTRIPLVVVLFSAAALGFLWKLIAT